MSDSRHWSSMDRKRNKGWIKIAILSGIIFFVWNGAVEAKTERFLVTAYCLKGITASGHYTVPGTIAVDPSLINFGSRLYVPGYGSGVARDTGSAIKGHHIDIWMPSCYAARQWGVRYKMVTY